MLTARHAKPGDTTICHWESGFTPFTDHCSLSKSIQVSNRRDNSSTLLNDSLHKIKVIRWKSTSFVVNLISFTMTIHNWALHPSFIHCHVWNKSANCVVVAVAFDLVLRLESSDNSEVYSADSTKGWTLALLKRIIELQKCTNHSVTRALKHLVSNEMFERCPDSPTHTLLILTEATTPPVMAAFLLHRPAFL